MDNAVCVAILGATSGLAQAVARQLCATATTPAVDTDKPAASLHLILVARNPVRLEQVADDLRARGAQVTSVVADLDEIDQHAQLLEQLESAAQYWFFYGSLPDQSEAQAGWTATHAALLNNFLGPVSLLTRIATRLETNAVGGNKGSIVVVGSVAGDRGRQSNYVYGAAKGGLALFCQGLRNRLAAKDISVLTVKPGFIDTPMTAAIEKKPAVLWATPEKVAADIVRAHSKGRDVLYTPWFWRYIMLVIRLIPERIFKRLSL